MKRVCAWCGRTMGWTRGRGVKGVTHGICKRCAQRLEQEAEGTAAGCSGPLWLAALATALLAAVASL